MLSEKKLVRPKIKKSDCFLLPCSAELLVQGQQTIS